MIPAYLEPWTDEEIVTLVDFFLAASSRDDFYTLPYGYADYLPSLTLATKRINDRHGSCHTEEGVRKKITLLRAQFNMGTLSKHNHDLVAEQLSQMEEYRRARFDDHSPPQRNQKTPRSKIKRRPPSPSPVPDGDDDISEEKEKKKKRKKKEKNGGGQEKDTTATFSIVLCGLSVQQVEKIKQSDHVANLQDIHTHVYQCGEEMSTLTKTFGDPFVASCHPISKLTDLVVCNITSYDALISFYGFIGKTLKNPFFAGPMDYYPLIPDKDKVNDKVNDNDKTENNKTPTCIFECPVPEIPPESAGELNHLCTYPKCGATFPGPIWHLHHIQNTHMYPPQYQEQMRKHAILNLYSPDE